MRCAVSHPKADEEAALYYEKRCVGLGDDFLDDYHATLAKIIENPQLSAQVRGENRKLNLTNFPYAVIYSINQDHIFIKAVMHLHRRPFYWIRRTERQTK